LDGLYVKLSVGVEAGQAARPIEDYERTIGLLVHANRGVDIVMPMRLLRDWQRATTPGHALVAPNLALQLRFLSYVFGPCDCLMRPSPI